MILLAMAVPISVAAQVTTEAQRGDIASGVVVMETPTELRLQTSPCTPGGHVVLFYAPYVKTKVGNIRCGSQVLDRIQVEKR